jgi:hypothetical protein
VIRWLIAIGAALAVAGASHAQQKGNPAGNYELSKAELELDCRKLTGRMQVRILQIRDFAKREGSSVIARLTQQATTPVFGGTQHGADPHGQYRRDIAMLYAYNRQLAAKKCPTFDLETELQPQSVERTPRPVAPKKGP